MQNNLEYWLPIILAYSIVIGGLICCELNSNIRFVNWFFGFIQKPIGVMLLLFVLTLGLFGFALHPDYVIFSSDGPVGAIYSEMNHHPSSWWALWDSSMYIGKADIPHYAIIGSGAWQAVLTQSWAFPFLILSLIFFTITRLKYCWMIVLMCCAILLVTVFFGVTGLVDFNKPGIHQWAGPLPLVIVSEALIAIAIKTKNETGN